MSDTIILLIIHHLYSIFTRTKLDLNDVLDSKIALINRERVLNKKIRGRHETVRMLEAEHQHEQYLHYIVLTKCT